MNRERDDDAVRRLARVDDEQVARVAGAAGREALLEGIVTMPDPGTTAPRRRRRASIVGGGIAVTLAASGTIGWAIVTSNARDTTTLLCQVGDSPSIIDAVSGDPVTDCAAEWQRQTGAGAPPLVAYDNGRGGVSVHAASDPAPAGSTPLPAGKGQNLAIIELQESLDDHVAGLSSRCFAEDAAVAFARAELGRLGLADWDVRPRPRAAHDRCTDAAIADAAARTVVLVASPGDPSAGGQPHQRLAARLREIARQCRPLAATRTAVEAAAWELGLRSDPSFRQFQVTAVPADAPCTTIRQRVGGSIFVTLRGPAA